MKIQQNKNSKSRTVIVIIAISVLILAIAGTGVYAISGSLFGWKLFPNESTSTMGDTPASNEQIKTGDSIKDNSLNNGGASGSDQPSAPAQQPDGRQLVGVDITSVNKIENTTQVSVLISAIDQTGSCSLKVMSADNTVTYTASAGVQPMSNTSTCKGFTIPNASIRDTYKIVVDFSSGNLYGTASYDNL